MAKMIFVDIEPEEVEKIKNNLMEAVRWFEGYEAGKGVKVTVKTETFCNLYRWITAFQKYQADADGCPF